MQQLFDLPEAYDEMLKKGIGITGNDKSYFVNGRLQMVYNHLSGDFEPKRILDFGCGTGETSQSLALHFKKSLVVGSDLSDKTIEFARGKYSAPNLQFIENDQVLNLEPFDLIYLNCVIHHVPVGDRQSVVNQLFSLLRAKGQIWIFENNPANPGTQLAMFTNPFDKGVVKVWPSRLKELMSNSGFTFEETGFLFYFPQWLSIFRPIEKFLEKLPLGGQYYVRARRI